MEKNHTEDEERLLGDVKVTTIAKKRNISDIPVLWNSLVIFTILLYSTYGILVHMSQVEGKVKYETTSVILLTELTKFLISLVLLVVSLSNKEKQLSIDIKPSDGFLSDLRKNIFEELQLPRNDQLKSFLKTYLPYSIPAIFYAVNNNLCILILEQMDPATYQLLSNFKILSTAILFRIFIKKKLTGIQWFSLSLLVLAGIVDGLNEVNKNSKVLKKTTEIHVTLLGAILMLIYCTISGLSGVFTEFIMKKKNTMNTHLQNLFLYSFGIAINFFAYLSAIYRKNEPFDLFKNYSAPTYLIVVVFSLAGILIGFILKYASNILRLFVISSSMIVTTALLIICFHVEINFYFIFSVILVITAIVLYYKK